MKKLLRLLFTIHFLLFTLYGFSQSNSKMDFYLAKKQQSFIDKKAAANQMLPMLIQGNIGGIKQLVKSNGGTFKYSYGNIAAIIIPVRALSSFNESGSVTRMEGAPLRMRPTNDSMRAKNHMQEVLDGLSPLPQAYNGKGIILGFVDTGIDYLHDDFRDSSGTRLKYYWDQNQDTNILFTPQPFGYGQSWTKVDIDLGLSNNSSSTADYGHGSNVAGSACGNGTCNGHQMGGCPKSDIIFVAFNFNNQIATEFTDAVQYIYTCADSLNEPCVINASLGGYDGSHDDSDLQGEMIDNMIAARQPGRVLVAAAGNAGIPYHVHDSLNTGDTTFTWFQYDGGLGFVDIPIFANCTDFNNIKFKIRCDKVQTGSYSERDNITAYTNIALLIGLNTFTVNNSLGQRLGVVSVFGETYGNGSYSLEYQITPDSTSYYWGFQATGKGRFDIWDYGTINGVKDTNGFAINPAAYPGIKLYHQPDTLETICSSFQCSPHVITAQTYFNRLTWIDCDTGVERNSNSADVPGGFVWATSRGPSRNFVRMKPDVAAAGNSTMSAFPTALAYCGTSTDSLMCHIIDGGTSMASPMVAAAAALYLNRYPSATEADIKNCLTATAYTDRFTGPASQLPNYNWGYGKLHTFDALTMCAPSAVPVVNAPSNPVILSVYPNPFDVSAVINYDFSGIKNVNYANIVVYDIMGKVVKTLSLNNNKGSLVIDKANLASGMYFYSLVVDGIRLKTEKLEVL